MYDRDTAHSDANALGDQAAQRRVRAPIHRRGGYPHQQNTVTLAGYLVRPRAWNEA